MNAKEKKLAKVLEVVNVGRVAMGYKPLKKLVKGDMHAAHSCPIKNSLKIASACYDTLRICDTDDTRHNKCEDKAKSLGKVWHKKVKDVYVNTPVVIAKFIKDFDNGEYPELEA